MKFPTSAVFAAAAVRVIVAPPSKQGSTGDRSTVGHSAWRTRRTPELKPYGMGLPRGFHSGSALRHSDQAQTRGAAHVPDRSGEYAAIIAPRSIGQLGAVGAPPRAAPDRGYVSIMSAIAMVLLSGCASAPMTRGGSLSSYENLTPSDGLLAKSLVRINKGDVLAAKTVRIMPTVFPQAASPTLSAKQRMLIANAVDRSLCVGLSERLRVVGADQPAELTAHVLVTQAAPTDEVVAGASTVVSFVPAALGVPAPVPRLPIGLGSLTLEAEAQDPAGKQQAAMIWARGANAFTNSPTVSAAGDAYDLATSFGGDFSQLLVTGSTPFGKGPSMPSLDKIGSSLGAKPKYAACEMFGRDPGIVGMAARRVGLPPEWSDKGTESSVKQ